MADNLTRYSRIERTKRWTRDGLSIQTNTH